MGYHGAENGQEQIKQRSWNFGPTQRQLSQIKYIQREDIRIALHNSFSQGVGVGEGLCCAIS